MFSFLESDKRAKAGSESSAGKADDSSKGQVRHGRGPPETQNVNSEGATVSHEQKSEEKYGGHGEAEGDPIGDEGEKKQRS